MGLILGYILHVTRGKYTMTKVLTHGFNDGDGATDSDNGGGHCGNAIVIMMVAINVMTVRLRVWWLWKVR